MVKIIFSCPEKEENMALMEILKYPDPFLKEKATPVEKIDDEIRKLITGMVETMYRAKGIGLAAPQVGSGKRVIVLDVPDDSDRREQGKNLMALVNPEITGSEGKTKYEEGCLSLPGMTADVERYAKVTVRAMDAEGNISVIEAEGLLAIALQHEIDHLDGILFIDRLSRLKREIIKRKYKKAMEETAMEGVPF